MLSLRSFLATILLLAAVQVAAKELAYYDSLRLVSAMREDERLVRWARAEKVRRTKLRAQDLECLDRLEYPEITDIVARQISDTMTAAEVQDALDYFQSASGRKLVRRELQALGEEAFATADQAELADFEQRSAGRKLLRELILRNSAVMAAVTERVEHHLEDCAYQRQSEATRDLSQKSCQARPVASSDNICLATYAAEGSGRRPERAGVEVNCRHDGWVLTSRISLPQPEAPIALRWSADRSLEILVVGKIKSALVPVGTGPKVVFASRQNSDPPPLACVTQVHGHPTLANTLPLNATVGAWRSYGRPGLCLMTARVPKEQIPGADGDMLLQFRRQKPAMAPFATTDLAVVVEINQQIEQPLLVDFGQQRLTLIAHPPQQKHMLSGTAAEALLEGLHSSPLDLTVQGNGVSGYSIPVRGLDFDFAYTEFNECLATLGAT